MDYTPNYNFPLLPDIPPENMTGKDLRNLILGENSSSLSSKIDTILKSVETRLQNNIDDITTIQLISSRCNISPKLGKFKKSSITPLTTPLHTITIGTKTYNNIVSEPIFSDSVEVNYAGPLQNEDQIVILLGSKFSFTTDIKSDILSSFGITIYALSIVNLLENSELIPLVLSVNEDITIPAEVVQQLTGNSNAVAIDIKKGVYFLDIVSIFDTLDSIESLNLWNVIPNTIS